MGAGEHVIHCPPSATYGNKVEASGCQGVRVGRLICCVLFAAAVITGFALLGVFLDGRFPSGDPVYSVAVTGVTGLDPTRDLSAGDRPTLSPVINLTVHINNARNSQYSACVTGLSTAVVSYGDAFLAKGSVPEFCARTMREREAAARVWGQDVVVPRFLRDQLAGELAVGEAAVDVQVTMPVGCSFFQCNDAVLVCKVKIGGGLSRCGVTYVQQQPKTPDASSTSIKS